MASKNNKIAFLRKNLKFVVLFLLCAGFITLVFKFPSLLMEWRKSPEYFVNNPKNFFSNDSLIKLQETRWNAFGPEREDVLSKVYYNKGFILVDRFFDYLTFLSPRFYFQAGDGTTSSPFGVEPLAVILFIPFVLGILEMLKNRNYRPIIFVLLFSLFAFILGKKSMPFLFPVMIIYLYIATKQLKNLPFVFVATYSAFLIGRMIWLAN